MKHIQFIITCYLFMQFQNVLAEQLTIGDLNKENIELKSKIDQLKEQLKNNNNNINRYKNSVSHLREEISIQKTLTTPLLDKNEQVQTSDFSPINKIIPSTYKVRKDINIIDNNNQIKMHWNKGRLFTSKEKHGAYYKISGYFINYKWTSSKESIYVPINMAISKK